MALYSTGLELVLNAAEGVLQIMVTDDETLLCFQEWHLPRKATEILTPALDNICSRLSIKPTEFRRIACVAGPGAFTGIRLVLTTAAAMRRAGHAQLASLDYLQALATTAVVWRGLLYPTHVVVMTHARENLVHFQPFSSYGPQIPAQPLAEAQLLSPAEAITHIAAKPCIVCGSALGRHPEIFMPRATGSGPAAAPEAVMLPDLVSPNAEALRLLARHGDYFPNDIEPKYIRPCDAIENLDHIAKTKGIDPREAHAKLQSILAREPASEE